MARKATYDPMKVTELRMELVQAALDVLNDDPKVNTWSQYKKDLILKMAPRALPVLNEHSGSEDNKTPIPIQISGVIAAKNGITPLANKDSS